MAPRKTTAGSERGASRKTQDAAGDPAGLAALTTTLLAGAVTGAVAGLVENAEARQAHHKFAAPSPDALAHRQERAEPEQARHGSEPAGDAVSLEPAETTRTETPQTTHGVTMAASHIDGLLDRLPADAGVVSALADPAGSPLAASPGQIVGSIAQAPVAEMASHNGASAASNDETAAARPGAASSVDAAGANQTTRLTDDMSSRLDDAIAGIGDRLADSVAAIDARPIDLVRTLGEVRETLDIGTDAALTRIDGQMSRVTDVVGDIGASVTHAASGAHIGATLDGTLSQVSDAVDDLVEILPVQTAAAIPATMLGAEVEQKQPDGLLARLFDTEDNSVSSPITMTHAAATPFVHGSVPGSTSHGGQGDQAASTMGPTSFAPPAMYAAVEAVKIGFAGQSYFDTADDHGSGGSHANLLHGLL